MQRFKRLAVFLHNSPSDAAALAYAGEFARLAHSETVYCVHVREPDESPDADPDMATFREAVRAQLPSEVARLTEVEIRAGVGVGEILKSARTADYDMLIVGRRLPSEHVGIGSTFARLARKAPCTVFTVPRGARPHLERLLIAVDFSEHSKLALENAIGIAKASGAGRPQLIVHSNAILGYGYTKLGLTLQQAVVERERVARQQLEEFVRQVDTSGVAVELVPTVADSTDDAILEVAISRKMDVIVVGSRGQGSVSILGSTPERLLHHSPLPVLIVKRKGETVPILEALFGS